ncbi:MAG: GAF domain-containing protein [Deltaproteobacteria bacterium]|jgi:L-methionine (R)-S-oxide reductase|nr:GAF domain-containing protein [Deltaproteobacteria bacterium]
MIDQSDLKAQLTALLADEEDWIANCAQFSAFVFQFFSGLNWDGFYFKHGVQLKLGPFQGKVACNPIALGMGVCGKAATTGKAIRVKDVHDFPGHIACDPVSHSEMVLPLAVQGKVLGVFDLDSPQRNRFTQKDQSLLTDLLEILIEKTDFKPSGLL